MSAQNFGYQFVKDSAAYSDLVGANSLLANENFTGKHKKIQLPFTFNFCGYAADSITITTNGYIVFDHINMISLISFNNFSGNNDSVGSPIASIRYKTEGSNGHRIAKIEFKNFSINTYTTNDNLTYQVWLYENGNMIEYHIGSNNYSTQPEIELPVLVGAINQSMNTETKAYLITGNAATPSGQLITGENELQYLSQIPLSGTIYRLNPSF